MFKSKVKKVVVAGCRDFCDYEVAETFIDECISDFKDTHKIIIVSGCATGADRMGELYAQKHSLKIERFPADWLKHGRSAGPIRNQQMAQVADLVLCFWDGKSRGTKSMIEKAEAANKPYKIKMI